MLTSLEIENFKGIATRQRIDLAPVTLLFGANSAGKSTILQALLYLHELIERGTADVDRTEVGGSMLELGGFARLVHRHQTERAIVLRTEFATPGALERFGRDLTDFPFSDLEDDIESAWLELTIRYRVTSTFCGPVVDSAVIGVNGLVEPLVWMELGTSLRDGEPLQARINLGHPLLASGIGVNQPATETDVDGTKRPVTLTLGSSLVIEAWEQIAIPEEGLEPEGSGPDEDASVTDVARYRDGRSLPVFALSRNRFSALPFPSEPMRVIVLGDESPEKTAAALQVRTLLEMVVLGTTTQLASFLRDAMYIGPLRTIPPRGFLYERPGRIMSWSDGLAAWDLLLADRLTLVERTNHWLRRLGAGCQVVVQQLFDRGATAEAISDSHVDQTVRRLLLDTGASSLVLPSEVGAGISQLVPVVVAALEGRFGVTLVEQPEIHVHPAVQVGLGDLFIEAATGENPRRLLLVETHSEHLLLRVMRRMRETAEGTLPAEMRPIRPTDVSIVLVEKDGQRSITRQMPLNERGELVKAWPGGFFEEGLREVF